MHKIYTCKRYLKKLYSRLYFNIYGNILYEYTHTSALMSTHIHPDAS